MALRPLFVRFPRLLRLSRFNPLPVSLVAWLPALLCSVATLLPAAQAQAASPAAKPIAAKPARPAKGAPKPPVARSALKNKAASLALATQTVEAISQGQLDVATRVLVGDADCEFNQRVSVTPVDGMPGYFNVSHQRKRYRMLPRETSTGAVRLEDPDAGIVWLQIPAKSMLMNTRIGQRVVDACLHAMQRAEANNPVLAGEGIGIAPQVAGAALAPSANAAPALAASAASIPAAASAPLPTASATPILAAASTPALAASAAPTLPAAPVTSPSDSATPTLAAAASAPAPTASAVPVLAAASAPLPAASAAPALTAASAPLPN